MATYNGEQFIQEQLDSIINQTYANWKLIIRDDCSTDNTVKIIKKYKDYRIQLIEGKENLGQVKNFNKLLEQALDANYVMFADQDDVWLNSKVEDSMKVMTYHESFNNCTKSILVYSKVRYVDQDLRPLDVKNANPDPNDKSIKTLLSYNYIWGCTMMLNKKLIQSVFPISEYAQNHDYWVALNASVSGEIVRLNEYTVLYRQHERNVTGGLNNRGYFNKFKKIKMLKKSYFELHKQNYEFCLKYSDEDFAREYIQFIKSKGLKKLQYMAKLRIRRGTLLETLVYYKWLLSS